VFSRIARNQPQPGEKLRIAVVMMQCDNHESREQVLGSEKSGPLSILAIGFYSTKVSGSSLSFKLLVDDLKTREEIRLQLVDTSRDTSGSRLLVSNIGASIEVVRQVLRSIRAVDVVTFQASRRGIVLFGPILAVMCRLHGKPLILRLFGGELDDMYYRLPAALRLVFRRTALAADLILLQTTALVSNYRRLATGRVEWLPTSRPAGNHSKIREERQRCTRLVYLGRVSEQKGLLVLAEAARLLPSALTIDVYGTFDDSCTEDDLEAISGGRIKYRGSIRQEEVISTLCRYDLLVLPTFYSGEGYPGVIVEAFMAGIPVVATEWKAIPEVVGDAGRLVPPKNVDALAATLTELYEDPGEYGRLQSASIHRACDFSSERWNGQFVAWCREVVYRRALVGGM